MNMAAKWFSLLIALRFLSLHLTVCSVTYDRKGLIINGQRRLLFSGSIHYPRSTPEMWPQLIKKAKDGGLEVIDTYVFWNGHEPSPGNYHFEGRYDLIRFLKLVQQAGLYVHLRIGPYVCAEWNFGGFPVWLKFVPGISFRTDNEPFKAEMEKFTRKIVQMVKNEGLYQSQGGPVILSQIENEYGGEEKVFGSPGYSYMNWAAKLALSLNVDVPWVMCKENDAPDPIINTCNGFYCDYFTPNKPYKPTMWTEAWTGWFNLYGGPVATRPVEDIAFAVARFIKKGGSFINYYMYHGGTNFGRTSGGPFITTSYDYDAPLDEYGLIREPKYSHLKDLHNAIKEIEDLLVSVDPNFTVLGHYTQAHEYTSGARCAAFLTNYNFYSSATVNFKSNTYEIPPWSISILPDCNRVSFNTAKVRVQPSQVQMVPTYTQFRFNRIFNERIAAADEMKTMVLSGLHDQVSITRDTTDYLWYTTSVEIGGGESFLRNGNQVALSVRSSGDVLHVFVNEQFAGSAHGKAADTTLNFYSNVMMRAGRNTIALLSVSVGLPNNGIRFEMRRKGVLGPVVLHGLDEGIKDLSHQNWIYKVGLDGEWEQHLGTSSTSSSDDFKEEFAAGQAHQPLTWYMASFSSPQGEDPLALDMSSMGKGQVWINGNHIGRYWNIAAYGNCTQCTYSGTYRPAKCESGCGSPSQKWYHVPRSWLKQSENSLVIFEETGGDISSVSLAKRWVRN